MSDNTNGKQFAVEHDGELFHFDGRFDRMLVDDLLVWADQRKASDVTISTDTLVFAKIGSAQVPITRRALNEAEVDDIVRHIYGENGPSEVKAGYDLDPAHEIRMPGVGRKMFRVNITAGRVVGADGISLTIRTLPDIPHEISTLGIERDIIDHFRPDDGMVLITGTTGSGKSTLLSSGIRMIVERPDANEKILEYSKPIEYVYDKVKMPSSTIWQVDVGRHLRPRGVHTEEDMFGYCVRNALRRAPTAIIIGESRDRATIQSSVEAALTGHVLYSTMHTIGVAETLRRSVLPFPGEQRRSMSVDIMDAQRMIVSQRLLPRVGGGRVGCREYMIFDADLRSRFMAVDYDVWPSLTREIMANKEGVKCQTMAEGAQKLFEQGLIDEHTLMSVKSR